MTLEWRIVTNETVPRVVVGPYPPEIGMMHRVDFPAAGTVTFSVQIRDTDFMPAQNVEEVTLTAMRVRR